MKNSKIPGAIHAFMFCAFFISFLFRTDTYLLHRMEPDPYPFFVGYLNAELPAYIGCASFFLWFAIVWNIHIKVRLCLVLMLTLSGIIVWSMDFIFVSYALIAAALCTAFPLAVNHKKFEPVRLFWAFTAMILAACFPNIDVYAGAVVLVTIIAQREIVGIRAGGRFILAFMLFVALCFGAFPAGKKNKVADVTALHFRQNYELMMLAYAQFGGIPEKTKCIFNHPWRNMNDLAAIVTKLSVDKNENMPAYFAGDQLRFSAEQELSLQGKHTPVPVVNPAAQPSVILIAYPAAADYQSLRGKYYGDAWRNYSFYTVEGLTKQKDGMKKNGVLAIQLPDEQDMAASILAAVDKVFQHTVILRWNGVYVFASDRKLTADYEQLDQTAVAAGIYKYMYAPYRILLFALSSFRDEAADARLMRAAANTAPRSMHDLPLLKTAGENSLMYVGILFRKILPHAVWIFSGFVVIYCFCRYWFVGVPGAKLPFQSFETGIIAGITGLMPVLAFSIANHVPVLKILTGTFAVLCFLSAAIMLLFVRGKNASSTFVRILMIILCICSFFIDDISKTMIYCVAILSGVAAVSAGQCPHRAYMPAWFLGLTAACLCIPFLWFSSFYYPAAVIIIIYIIFAGYKKIVQTAD